MEDSIVHAASSSLQSIFPPETLWAGFAGRDSGSAYGPLVCEEQGASLTQRIGVHEGSTKRRRLWTPRFKKKTFRGSCKDRLVGNLLDSFDVLGFAGKLYRDFSELSDDLEKQHRDLMRERLSSFSSSALASSCSALSRWIEWARRQGVDPFPAAPLTVALWLRSLSLKFPTSASSAFSALRWLETHLGFDFGSNDPSIAYWRAPNQGHLVTQASPFTLKQWFQLEKAAVTCTGPCQALPGCMVGTSFGCCQVYGVLLSVGARLVMDSQAISPMSSKCSKVTLFLNVVFHTSTGVVWMVSR